MRYHRTEVQEVNPTAKCGVININADVPCQHSEWCRNRLCPLAAVVSGTCHECLALAPVCPQRFYQWLLGTSTPHPTEPTHQEDLPGNGTIWLIKTIIEKLKENTKSICNCTVTSHIKFCKCLGKKIFIATQSKEFKDKHNCSKKYV